MDVLVAGGAPATRAILILMTAVTDPVALGFVASLAGPGGNSTGSGYMGPETATKRLELLEATVPRITRVAVLFDPDGPTGRVTLTAMELVARALSLTLQPVGVRSPDDFTDAFSAMAVGRADALVLLPDAVIHTNVRWLADLAIKQRLPSVGFRE